MRLLLVEDDRLDQRVAQGFLSHLGHSTDLADDGVEALRALERKRYDAVLLDMHMPNMDGYALAARVRDPSSAVLDHEVWIIAMTAMAVQGDRDRCLQAGMDDYLSKPITVDALESALARCGQRVA